MTEPAGLMMAMMQPPPTMEEEFQDWYDTEHFPERRDCKGFVTAQRLLCLDGFPRYLALYDLENRAVLEGPGYGAIARSRYSQWTKRIVPRMWGHYRAEADQIFPGRARLGANGTPTRLALWRFSGVDENAIQATVNGVRTSWAETPGVLQLRVFQAKADQTGDVIATIELAGSMPLPAPRPDAFGPLLRHLNLANLYMPYWR
ncbi:MAG TPA: hypothetical protein VHB27_02095 [Rhodopila sp.]|uniref:hypothetical protein n=1 Tax=Rhodopila sp. TaxID=2480087 RepID=UPI002C308846|nr:hypothetical protein [Rhodopila sp.]HVY13991.1 hypothetical protein [Rhodopila sp.]